MVQGKRGKRSRQAARAGKEKTGGGVRPPETIAHLQRERDKLADDLAAAQARIAVLEQQRTAALERIDRAIALLQALLKGRE